MSPVPGPMRTTWIATGVSVVAGVVAVSVLLSVPVPTGRTTPEPLVRATPSATSTPLVDQPWYRTSLPVDGDLVSIGAHTVGHVTVTRTGEQAIRVTITGFDTDLAEADMRVQLTGGDVVPAGRRAEWIPLGDPVEVGVIAHDATGAVIDVRLPQILPPAVHSLLVLDWNTATIMGGAELLPAR
ncbi:hypothetical protein ACLBWP_17320 [Microbacterium sp. M1A1_1b]